jgi:PEP-CTERM motif
MKNTISSLVAVVALAALGTTPVYASAPWYCGLPVISQFIPACAPSPGGGGGRQSVPEPASIAILATGAGLVAAALRRRRSK